MGSGDDDDLVELKDMPRVGAVRNELNYPNDSTVRTPPNISRASTAAPAGNLKRPQGQVIDLTNSSDNDSDEPPRAPKRQATQSNLNGLSDCSHVKPLTSSNYSAQKHSTLP